MPNELPIPKPEVRRRISALEVLTGPYLSPEVRIAAMNEDDYEVLVYEWVSGYLSDVYQKIRAYAGAGDKGRDIVGYYRDGGIDIYQCKHYDGRIAPTDIYVELGKLCYYTHNADFPVPKKYFIVAPQGCGPTVLDMLAKPQDINQLLLDNWEKNCKSKITKTKAVELSPEFEDYIRQFDFSIISDIDPSEFVKQHAQTQYHILRFGAGIRKFRDKIPEPDPNIQIREQRYTESLFEVYQESLGIPINNVDDLMSQATYFKHFVEQRRGFYSSESLEKFSRENFPDSTPCPFDELKDDAEKVVETTLALHDQESGYKRVLLASQEIKRQNFTNSPLSLEIKPLDKDGLCHHLINEERIHWITKKN